MKRKGILLIAIIMIVAFAGCHSNPHNSFGGPSDHPKDTSAKKRDTSSATH